MNSVQRSRGIRKIIRRFVFGRWEQKYVLAGDKACRGMMRCESPRRRAFPSDSAILARARYDSVLESISGFWEVRAV